MAAMLPLLALGGISALGHAAAPAPAVSSASKGSEYNPVTNVNVVNGNGNLNAVADLISSINAGNGYNGSFSDFGLNSSPIGGGIQLQTGLLGTQTKFSVGPLILIGGVIALLFWIKKRS